MPNDNQGRLTVWGRANSVNVQKVLWCLRELDLAYQRIDAGMAFGRNHDPDYLAINPNARVPTLVDGDFVLWESNSIMRYLVLAHGKGSPVYPEAPKRRAGVDRWLDWTLSTLQPVDRPVFWALVRTPVEQRDMARIQKDADAEAEVWRVAEAQLSIAPLHRGRRLYDCRYRARRLCATLVRGGRHRKAEAAPARTLVRAICGPAGIRAIHRAADVVRSAPAGGDADTGRAADLDAGARALDLDETRAVGRTGIAAAPLPSTAAICRVARVCRAYGG